MTSKMARMTSAGSEARAIRGARPSAGSEAMQPEAQGPPGRGNKEQRSFDSSHLPLRIPSLGQEELL